MRERERIIIGSSYLADIDGGGLTFENGNSPSSFCPASMALINLATDSMTSSVEKSDKLSHLSSSSVSVSELKI